MAIYPDRINKRFSAAKARLIDGANAVATSASFVCGSFARLSLRVGIDGTIEDASFKTNGCGFMITAADVVAEWLGAKALTDLHGLDEVELRDVVVSSLTSFPEDREHCAEVVFEALRKSLAEYRRTRLHEFKGEEALICTCFGVTEDTIVDVITANDISDVDEVADICRAGAGCGSCRMLIRELIESERSTKSM